MMDDLSHAHQQAIQSLILIDDSDDEAFLVNRLLKRCKLEATFKAFHSIEDFQQFTAASTPEEFDAGSTLLVIDLFLHSARGTDALPELIAQFPQLPLGISTGSDDPDDRADAFASGAWFFVGKPLDRACLTEICSQAAPLHLEDTSEGNLRLYLDTNPS